MRNLVLGSVLVVWGIAVLVHAHHSQASYSGAYGAGQTGGRVLAVGQMLAGAAAVIKELRARRARSDGR